MNRLPYTDEDCITHSALLLSLLCARRLSSLYVAENIISFNKTFS